MERILPAFSPQVESLEDAVQVATSQGFSQEGEAGVCLGSFDGLTPMGWNHLSKKGGKEHMGPHGATPCVLVVLCGKILYLERTR